MADAPQTFDNRTVTTGHSSVGSGPERLYDELRERILNFDLPPGCVLNRIDLATRYGVSQTPVRDALQRLAQEGLVLIYPQSKTIVAPIDMQKLGETHFLRMSVETEVVRRLSLSRPEGTLKRARAIVQMQQTLIEAEGDMDMFTDLDRKFHRTLFEAVNMVSLHTLLSNRLGHLYRCQRLELPRAGKQQDIVQAHQSILDGIAAKDADSACKAMRAHLSGTVSRIDAIHAAHPAYFSEIPSQF